MSQLQFRRYGLLAIAGLLSMSFGSLSAQELDDTGYVRISDKPISQIQLSSCTSSGCVNSPSGAFGTGAFAGQACGNGRCGNGRCGNGVCGNGLCGNGVCGNGACGLCPFGLLCGGGLCGTGCGHCNGPCSQSVRNILCFLNPCSTACTHSPSHGFRPPVKVPYSATPVLYQHNFPGCWTGGGSSGGYAMHRPAVYMPTDTTQLGYYYQRVAPWVPMPNMIPPPMQPAQWHQLGPSRAEHRAAMSQYGSNGAYCPPQGTVIESAEPTIAPESGSAPPAPEPASQPSGELERSVSNPNLLPVVR